MTNKIKDLTEVKSFIEELVVLGINFHPDTDFADYIGEDSSPAISDDKAQLFNERLKQSLLICEKENVDPYSFMLDCYLECSGLNTVIPSPGEFGNS
ncbi:hypothetical protein [Phaeodactylibacter xiamenensis]|uniref:hypothetical protein n=1 Tax=Phaeodactylibacter xiamenensis TaxID=1524460 RepID=UPI0024A88406|nr:hypothetical protein [Phaeodactylibacter xiamenensis]